MSTLAPTPSGENNPAARNLLIGQVRALLDTVDKCMVVADRQGRVLLTNTQAKKCLEDHGASETKSWNVFRDLLNVVPHEILQRIAEGEHTIEAVGSMGSKAFRARVKWIPECDWLTIQFENEAANGGGWSDAADRRGTLTGKGDYLPQLACCLSETSGSKSPEDHVPCFGGARIEDPTGGD